MYQLIFSRKIETFLAKLHKANPKLFEQFIKAFDKISEDPYCAKALVGNLKGYYSYRVRDYRIIFEIKKQQLAVYVEKIAHRKEVYKK